MSAFQNLTPTLQLIVENPFLRKLYPTKGTVLAVVDSGYEGFLAVPPSIFGNLRLNELRKEAYDNAGK